MEMIFLFFFWLTNRSQVAIVNSMENIFDLLLNDVRKKRAAETEEKKKEAYRILDAMHDAMDITDDTDVSMEDTLTALHVRLPRREDIERLDDGSEPYDGPCFWHCWALKMALLAYNRPFMRAKIIAACKVWIKYHNRRGPGDIYGPIIPGESSHTLFDLED